MKILLLAAIMSLSLYANPSVAGQHAGNGDTCTFRIATTMSSFANFPIENLVIEFKEYKDFDGKKILIYNVRPLIEGSLIAWEVELARNGSECEIQHIKTIDNE